MTEIRKSSQLFRVGSFGTPIRRGENNDSVTEIWFCGAENGHHSCAHRSYKDAANCPRRAEALMRLEWEGE